MCQEWTIFIFVEYSSSQWSIIPMNMMKLHSEFLNNFFRILFYNWPYLRNSCWTFSNLGCTISFWFVRSFFFLFFSINLPGKLFSSFIKCYLKPVNPNFILNLWAIIKIRQNCNVYLMQGGFLNLITAHRSGPADLGTDRYLSGQLSFLPHPEG